MTQTSAIPAVIDALITAATAALPDIRVIDGPGISDDSHSDWLFIGVDDPESDNAVTAAEATSDWDALGARQRKELIQIRCAAVSWSGDDNMKAARDAAFATVAAVEQIIVADPTLGLGVLIPFATFSGVDTVRQNTTEMGANAQALFAVAVRSRLL